MAGFVAAEGTFGIANGGKRFRFAVGLGAADEGMCTTLRTFFGVGSVYRSQRRKPHYDDEVTYVAEAQRDVIEVIVPFMDAHLPESHKRRQYLEWRELLLDYWEHKAKRRRPCTVDGCDAPQRAHGLCRHHLWALRRQ